MTSIIYHVRQALYTILLLMTSALSGIAALFRRILFIFSGRRRWLLYLGGGAVAAVIIGLGAYQVIIATESSEFCGTVCHTPMYPEYTTYQASPHSTVECTACHVGAGTANLISSKARGIPQLFQVMTDNYPRPIDAPADNLRPARETCEKCHSPQKFSGDIVRTHATFATDEANTRSTNTIVLKLGGGNTEVAGGIHWHIVSKVWFVAMGDDRLDIGWVGVEKDGDLEEWVNPAFADQITPQLIEAGKRQMECVDCHNRATHIFSSPNDLLDKALAEGTIDANIPYIKKIALDALGVPSPSLEAADAKVNAIEGYYQTNYPDIYAEHADDIKAALTQLKEITRLTTFPEMGVDWNTHPDHSGHNKPPEALLEESGVNFTDWATNTSDGCFRCHGTLTPAVETATTITIIPDRESLSIECDLCHYTKTSGVASPLPKAIPHPREGLDDCLVCHGAGGPQAFPDDHPWSSNEACQSCHQPAPEPTVTQDVVHEQAVDIPHPTAGLESCMVCHEAGSVKPVSADHPWTTEDTCSACHELAPDILALPAADPITEEAPDISHPVGGLDNCLICHGKNEPQALGIDHPWATNETCTACHASATELLGMAPEPVVSGNPPPDIPHLPQGLEDCFICHAKSGPVPVVADHPWSTNETCGACHADSPTPIQFTTSVSPQPPVIPHGTSGMEDCRQCHGSGAAPAPPPNHAVIPGNYCTLCHVPA